MLVGISPTKNGIATTYNGTATVIPLPINGKFVTVSDVPISIKLGNTPIYGVQRGMSMQMMSMK